jgi:hypothetical protein
MFLFSVYHIPSGLFVIIIIIMIIIIAKEINSLRRSNVKSYTRSKMNNAHKINPLNTKRKLLYLKTQFVPRSKHFSSRL